VVQAGFFVGAVGLGQVHRPVSPELDTEERETLWSHDRNGCSALCTLSRCFYIFIYIYILIFLNKR